MNLLLYISFVVIDVSAVGHVQCVKYKVWCI